MQWLNLAVKSLFSWPDALVNFEFEGHRIALQPLTAEHAATISVHDGAGTTFAVGGHILGRFLSRLAWSHYAGVIELFHTGSNHPDRPGLLGRGTYGHSPCGQVAPWRSVELPVPLTKEAELALALFREGMSVNSITFQFLSYFKVLNIFSSKGADQIGWINSNIAHIT